MSTKDPIRVVLADDHAIIRQGIRRLLERDPKIRVVGESSTGVGAIHLVNELKPDVLLLDIEMPDMKGYHVARELRAKQVPVSILALSTCDEDHFIQETLRSGMDGYVSKSDALTKLQDAVHCVVEQRMMRKLTPN